MRSVAILLGVVVIMLLSPAIIDSVADFRTDEYTAQYDMTTSVNETDTDITLTEAVFGNATANIEVSSNVTADAPVASAYVSATKIVTISGLEDDTSHRLTLIYPVTGLGDYIGAGVGAGALPLLLILGLFGLIAAAVYSGTRGD